MSEQVTYKGNIIEVEKETENIGDKIWNILTDEQRVELLKNPDKYSDLREFFLENDLYEDYIISKYKLFKINKCEKLDYDLFVSSKNSDESIDFAVSYYNGGCSFPEAIEEALKNLEE